VFGYSPRMRFDLAINGMTHGAWKTGRLPLLRDGTQQRPMVHVRDTAAAQIFMLEYEDADRINGEIFNVGSAENNYELRPLAETIRDTLPVPVEIEWYGDPDHRSYQVDFRKIESLGWRASLVARDGCLEVFERLERGELERTPQTITLDWYRELDRWHRIVKETELHGGMLDL
jgi:nucleoside-diphosphate-sugar epimerase